MSVLYFLIADKLLQKNIGSYINTNLLSDEALEEIKQKAADLLSSETAIDKSTRYKAELQHTFVFYYLCLPSTLYITAVTKGCFFTMQNNLIFELIEDVDSQGIRKLVDKQGNLIKVALQNLRYSIDKYQSMQKESNNGIIDRHSSEISSTSITPSENKDTEDKPIIDSLDQTDSGIKELSETPIQLKDDILIPKKPFRLNRKVYIGIGLIIILMLLTLIIVYNK